MRGPRLASEDTRRDCKPYNKKLLSRIRLSAAGKGDLTGASKKQGDQLSEAEAIERARSGDAEAFEVLYNLHKRRVYSLCLRMTTNTAEAEDLTQEAFLQLFRKIGTFRGESAFSTWLHRMAVNVVLMRLRKKGLQVVPIEETVETEEETPKKELGAPDPALAGSIDRLQMQKAVESLPPGYRTIFVLHDVEGYEHNEIAEIVGCSIGNSKSQLHKARMKLRELLKTSRTEKVNKP
ncbi:MAG TPA: sigma-70 family RNA polymerase sigma factor [Terriglobales bacterium]|nr:sigma-70 family RNA polymerase sigma factor [Terriglobales bacterium]